MAIKLRKFSDSWYDDFKNSLDPEYKSHCVPEGDIILGDNLNKIKKGDKLLLEELFPQWGEHNISEVWIDDIIAKGSKLQFKFHYKDTDPGKRSVTIPIKTGISTKKVNDYDYIGYSCFVKRGRGLE